ncbi:aminotransferase class I/II-fold pyridoxal phosphate-dependent enzyme [Clostridium sp. E02]|uniref:aminotransferase class I/II-fold pyridoxal phosphate-dependent enzyme n=1 Tax=Clostridium sp. E02 TaxID=2487134 RepID=UPI000F53DE33|nr:aminotransferase class I/II-fold pyridoxal phosphate-dependent enzyme [Clostridium sp. E02]
MNQPPNLLKKLEVYGKTDFYPFHMPGHKRQYGCSFGREFPNPYSIDLTEIEGFDNLHNPVGILKESMDWASSIYGSDRSYYLVNGSSCGILSAISATVPHGGTILVSRNCHKSVFHGVFLNQLQVEYVYPHMIEEFGVQSGLIPETVEKMLINHPEIKAVLIVSPTYDGVVSDIEKIAKIVHNFQIPLIVDEAHGAHFPFGKNDGFPVSAIECGADVVIQSLHKTLPSFTQTAIMHVKEGYVDIGKLNRYTQMYQTSSPSYVLLAGIENCIRFMTGEGMQKMKDFSINLARLRDQLSRLDHFKLLRRSVDLRNGIFDLDPSKIIISTRNTSLSGKELMDILRSEYHLEMEMCSSDSITAITTLMDTKEGFDRLVQAMSQIDEKTKKADKDRINSNRKILSISKSECPLTIAEAMDQTRTRVLLEQTVDRISTEFVYVYPPGIPIVTPGEILSKEIVEQIKFYKKQNLMIQGMEDETADFLYVVEK